MVDTVVDLLDGSHTLTSCNISFFHLGSRGLSLVATALIGRSPEARIWSGAWTAFFT